VKVNRIAEKVSRVYYQIKIKDTSVNFLSITENKNDCLVCMPSRMEHLLDAASKLPDIASVFPNRIIKVLITSSIDPRSFKFIKRFTIIKPYSYDMSLFYLPKKAFVQKIVGKGLSICIDLDFEPNFFNSCISVLTRAPLRIGVNKGLGLPYYNLEIEIGDREAPSKMLYDNFIKVLYNFSSEGEKIAPVET